MADIEYKPLGSQVALKILDMGDDEDDKPTSSSYPTPDDDYNKAILAIVKGIGTEVKAKVKMGDTVFVRKYAKDGIRLEDDVVIADEYCLLATVRG